MLKIFRLFQAKEHPRLSANIIIKEQMKLDLKQPEPKPKTILNSVLIEPKPEI